MRHVRAPDSISTARKHANTATIAVRTLILSSMGISWVGSYAINVDDVRGVPAREVSGRDVESVVDVEFDLNDRYSVLICYL
ncbi:Uncharacterised protein [Bordetella pertussis]|nr:Uncharacterised protein [Bordetella pertussis]